MEVQDTLDTLSKGLLIYQGILGGKKKVQKKKISKMEKLETNIKEKKMDIKFL